MERICIGKREKRKGGRRRKDGKAENEEFSQPPCEELGLHKQLFGKEKSCVSHHSGDETQGFPIKGKYF